MRDVLSWRAKFGVVCPSTNAVVEPDYYSMKIPGVTCHFARIKIADPRQDSDAAFQRVLAEIRSDLPRAVDRVMDVDPDYLILGMSAETFWGGLEGNQQLKARLQAQTGRGVATGAEAMDRALRTVGARRVGLVTPYQPVGDAEVAGFLGELGYDVVSVVGLKCSTTRKIAQISEQEVRAALERANGDGVDALLQVGTNLSALRLAEEVERWLGKPVIAINAATWWMALRENGIPDRLEGFGVLLREH
jgi:maleate isomerase